ncbi:MAG: homocysteine S-methyltransferase family protein [Spirochaetaceae bacterium]|jgi:5-methyltetrahydrofolate--homocysteine methyltransferase|nr:homocysteine S-methyltransferase family protein [Spirochaetaceae bacterium]
MTTRKQLDTLAAERILILDGAMGSLIRNYNLTEADFRGSRFADHKKPLAGCNDLLCLTKPDLIYGIHKAYLEAGADIIETCSFNATSVSLADYGIGHLAYEISRAAASLARQAADAFSTPDKPRFVAGSMGPTAKSAGIPPDINDPAKRSITWDELAAAYYDNARGLLDGGADILLVETIFDTLNAKAALFAISRLLEEGQADSRDKVEPELRRGVDPDLPIMISVTVSGDTGRLLTGQTLEDFCASVFHARPWSVGLNCSFGAELLKPHIRKLASLVSCPVSAYPNAGMPDQNGEYAETPESMAAVLTEYMREGMVNILGGCCGSGPDHIAAIAAAAKNFPPRPIRVGEGQFSFSGLKSFPVTKTEGFSFIGKRINPVENDLFTRFIGEADYDGAVELVREMIEKDEGPAPGILNINMDGTGEDAQTAMTRFLNLALSYPDIAGTPIMLESSRWDVIEAGLKTLSGKGIVNALSLTEGTEEFRRKARLILRYGAAVLVRPGDRPGPEKAEGGKTEALRRAQALLTEEGFSPEDIIFDVP